MLRDKRRQPLLPGNLYMFSEFCNSKISPVSLALETIILDNYKIDFYVISKNPDALEHSIIRIKDIAQLPKEMPLITYYRNCLNKALLNSKYGKLAFSYKGAIPINTPKIICKSLCTLGLDFDYSPNDEMYVLYRYSAFIEKYIQTYKSIIVSALKAGLCHTDDYISDLVLTPLAITLAEQAITLQAEYVHGEAIRYTFIYNNLEIDTINVYEYQRYRKNDDEI